jgi:hypothetical protein
MSLTMLKVKNPEKNISWIVSKTAEVTDISGASGHFGRVNVSAIICTGKLCISNSSHNAKSTTLG